MGHPFVVAAGIALVLSCRSGQAAPEIHGINATRTSGAAPLAVVFDATNTRDAEFEREFHSLRYEWDFGDVHAAPQTWRHSGRPKGQAFGAVAGHVFEHPGTFTVTLLVTNPAGAQVRASLPIEVQSAEEAIGRASTYCFANPKQNPGNWEGCPLDCGGRDGPRCVALQNFDTAVRDVCGATRAARRCLFRRGDTFALRSRLSLTRAPGPGLIGAFGPRASPPIVESVAPSTIEPGSDWRITGLELRGKGGVPFDAASTSTIRNFTLFDVAASGFASCLDFFQRPRVREVHRGIAVVDFSCTELDPKRAEGWGLFGAFDHSMFMGLHIESGGGRSEGNLRTVHAHAVIIQHGLFTRTRLNPKAKGAISLRACGSDNSDACKDGDLPDRYVIFSDNNVQSMISTPIRSCTHSECDPQGTNGSLSTDHVWERNFITAHETGAAPRIFWIQGGDYTVRHNVVDFTGIDSKATVWLVHASHRGSSANGLSMRDRVHVYNNTFVINSPVRGVTLCGQNRGSGHVCRNNLLYAPQAGVKNSTFGEWETSNNLREGHEYRGFPFAVPYRGALHTRLLDFRLESAAAAVDRGFDFSRPRAEFSYVDAALGCGGAGSSSDVGAFEHGAKPCGSARAADGAESE